MNLAEFDERVALLNPNEEERVMYQRIRGWVLEFGKTPEYHMLGLVELVGKRVTEFKGEPQRLSAGAKTIKQVLEFGVPKEQVEMAYALGVRRGAWL